MAQSRAELTEMLHDVKQELSKFGLRLNVEKCVVQCNCFRDNGGFSIVLDGMEMLVVPAKEGVQVLGTKYTLWLRCCGI